jgi:hypothetical protein
VSSRAPIPLHWPYPQPGVGRCSGGREGVETAEQFVACGGGVGRPGGCIGVRRGCSREPAADPADDADLAGHGADGPDRAPAPASTTARAAGSAVATSTAFATSAATTTSAAPTAYAAPTAFAARATTAAGSAAAEPAERAAGWKRPSAIEIPIGSAVWRDRIRGHDARGSERGDTCFRWNRGD